MQQKSARRFRTAAWLLVAGWALTGHAYGDASKIVEMATIEGKVWYRERMPLPPGAQIEVSLQDVAKMDVAADVISTLRFQPEGGPPFAFSLEYDPSRIQSRGRYAIRARIDADSTLLFTTTEHIGAFDAQSGEPVCVMVSRIPERRRPH